MTILTQNVSPLIPHQFPDYYRENNPTFVAFMQEYYKWMEQANNTNYYTRNIYQLKDIDTTLEEFIIHFKKKYLRILDFNTQVDIRWVIKHALDIYRSKGTERCAILLFQVLFDKKPAFYYPSTDLFQLDDGEFIYPHYLELSLNWEYNSQLNQKEIVGIFSGARAFVDSMVRRKTNSRLEDVVYISAIVGQFLAGEKVKPVDNSLEIEDCPTIQGSLNSINMLQQGSGSGYVIGSSVPVSSMYGNSAIGKVLASANAEGQVQLQFVDGGYGYQVNAVVATIHINNLSGSFTAGSDIYTYYGNNALMGMGSVVSANSSVVVADVLTGNLNNAVGKIFSFGNTSSANVTSYVGNTPGPNVYISNATMTISSVTMNTANLEQIHYFDWLETITEPMVTIDYISSTNTFVVGTNVYTYFANGDVDGTGTVLASAPGASNTGEIVVSVLSGNLHSNNRFWSFGNVDHANTSVFTDTSATGLFIANSASITLNLDNVSGIFLSQEEIFQNMPLTGPVIDEKIGGWGFLSSVRTANVISCNLVEGRIIQGPITGLSSGTTANVVSVVLNIGITNTSGAFLASPYAYVYSKRCSGKLTDFNTSGSSFTISVLPLIDYPETISTPIDKIYTFGSTKIGAAGAIGFPAKPTANSSNTSMHDTWTFAQTTVGKLSSVVTTGQGSNFSEVPYIVMDNPWVSEDSLNDAFVAIANATGTFVVGELITQGTTNARGIVLASSNSEILVVQRLSYSNNFIITTGGTNQITGFNSGSVANVTSVDADLFSQVMGRNALTDVLFTTGNNVLTNVGVIDSGYGFINGDPITIGSNGAVGTAVLGGMGTGSGFYLTRGGFVDDVKKLYDGWFYQNFSYQVISPLMQKEYQDIFEDITHVAGTLMFGRYVHTGLSDSNVNFQKTIININ